MKEYLETKDPELMNVLKGVEIASIEKDNTKHITGITLRDEDGNCIKFKQDQSYSSNIIAVVEKPPEMKNIFQLDGTLFEGAIPVCLKFETQKEAENKLSSLTEKDDSADLKIEKVKGAIEEKKPELHDDLPF